MRISLMPLGALVGVAAIAGGGAAIAASNDGASAARKHRHRAHAPNSVRGYVHAEFVVPKRDGSFITKTVDRGRVVSVEGRQLTVREGTATAEYKTVTLTIPENARVRVNGERSSLSNVKPGQKVTVTQSADATVVSARDPGQRRARNRGRARRR